MAARMQRMLRRTLAAAGIAVLAGCASVRPIDPESLPEKDWTRINYLGERDGSTVVLSDGSEVRGAEHLRWEDGRVTWTGASGEPGDVSVRRVSRITVVDRRPAAVRGVILGLLAGGTAGAFITRARQEDDDPCPILDCGLEGTNDVWEVVLGGFAGAGAGAVVGGLTGRAIGARTTYVITPGTPETASESPDP